ncbi:MAG: hypothetical protein ACJ8MO_41065 [Bacillus sp. (in: firmicutes)]
MKSLQRIAPCGVETNIGSSITGVNQFGMGRLRYYSHTFFLF